MTQEGSETQRDLTPKKEAYRRIKDPLGRSGPRGGPPQLERPGGGAGRPPWCQLGRAFGLFLHHLLGSI
jgi:hypothetical protein